MPYYKPCPDCGANLDPSETCDCTSRDCKKKIGLPDANQISPKKGRKPLTNNTIAQRTEFVKSLSVPVKENPLRELRLTKNIPVKEMVSAVRRRHPKYDKNLHSKCERSEDYGIELCMDAMNDLRAAYAPEQLEMPVAEKHRRNDGHKLAKRISCRLKDEDYEKLLRFTREDGFDQMQAWLTHTVRQYIKRKMYDVTKALAAQRSYCMENHVPDFTPGINGGCPRCMENIFVPREHPDGSVTGITVEGAGKRHITYCPHCRASFID